MSSDQEKRVVEALVDFVERVCRKETTSETEIAVLPEVAKVLLDFSRNPC